MKKSSVVLGYILAITVIMPIVLYVISFLFFKGNRNSDADTESYINNSVFIDIDFSPDQKISRDSKVYMSKLGMKNNTKVYNSYIFYSEKYHKYFNLISFNNIEYTNVNESTATDKNIIRNSMLISDNKIIKVRVNNNQWDNPDYGTKEKPLPIFINEIIEVNGRRDHLEDYTNYFNVNDDTNRKFVDQYLRFFMPEDEFKSTFRN